MFKPKTRLQKLKLGTRNKRGRTIAEGNKLVDTSLLQHILNQCCVCKFCKKMMGKLDILEDVSARKDLAKSLFFKCKNCGKKTHTHTSKRTSTGISTVNVRSASLL